MGTVSSRNNGISYPWIWVLVNGQPGGFTVFSQTKEGGKRLEEFLNNLYSPIEKKRNPVYF
jgi:hypothetical protein